MASKIFNKELQIKSELVHVEFEGRQMKTFVWLANHDDLGNHQEFMSKFFESMEEHSVRVDFDLYEDMTIPTIELFEVHGIGSRKVDREDEHVFVALRNKLEKCLDALNSIKYIDMSKREPEKSLVEVADVRNLPVTQCEKFNQRLKNVLMINDVFTIGALENFTEYDLIAMPNLGRKSLQEVKEYMLANNLKLKR